MVGYALPLLNDFHILCLLYVVCLLNEKLTKLPITRRKEKKKQTIWIFHYIDYKFET